jgi:uncharacterized protein YPO0396
MTLLEIPEFDEQFAAEDAAHVGQWRLARVELVNWGTFDGHYRIDVGRRGHLFTGASGSGKSSLLDAIATVLTPGRWLRFNAAAQDTSTRNDDRSLVSYVRGAWSKEADELEDRAVSTYLRTGPTWSGILLRFENARDAPVTLVRLLHLRGGSVDKADLKDLAFLDRGDVDLLEFEPFVASGIEARRIKAAWPSALITTNGTHRPYFVRLCRVLGISNENALQLLHKTQSAKNLGSLDQLFRSFMLDKPTTFARAENAVEQFGELNEAHRLVVEARDQLEHLRGLDTAIDRYETAVAAATEAERLNGLIDPFQNRLLSRLVADERVDVLSRRARAESDATAAAVALQTAEEELRIAERSAHDLGGADAARARERLADAEKAAKATAGRWQQFADELGSVSVAPPSHADEFAELRETARAELAASTSPGQPDGHSLHEHDDNREFFEARDELRRIDRELDAMKNRKSNLPAALLLARRQLADDLGINESVLPFAGELIEVQPDFADWTGAIERVLYPIASALLVRDEHLAQVRRLIEGRHLGARLVFEAVPPLADRPRAARTDRSLLQRVRVVGGPFHDWLTWRLAEEFDFECVNHPDDLDDAVRGVTIGGQLKKSARRYEKNDRFAIGDRSKWILGADNAAKIDALLDRRRDAARRQDAADARLKQAQSARDAETRRRTVLESVLRQDWADLDREAAEERVRSLSHQLDLVTIDNGPLRNALAFAHAAVEKRDGARTAEREAALRFQGLAASLAELEAEIGRLAEQTSSETLGGADFALLESKYRAVQRKLDRRSISEVGRRVAQALHNESAKAQEARTAAQSAFERGAYSFRSRWPTASADLTTSIGDRAGYRELRTAIESRGLPAHEQKFLKLLRDKSRELIGHLLSDIRDAPKLIKERIDPVNSSLGRSEFDRDRFLRIKVKEHRTPEVVQFMTDLRTVVDGSWDDEDLAAAESRFAVLGGVMRKLASGDSADVGWRQRCLDTREHVTFQAQEVDRAARITSVHDSSAGLSGGQRQKLAIFCLAAALRYQLAPDDDAVPSFATIILDEAFDKADSNYTRMAMDVFVAFGFHMILATPQKLLSTIEPYVDAVTSITNETHRKSTIANVVFGTEESADREDAP